MTDGLTLSLGGRSLRVDDLDLDFRYDRTSFVAFACAAVREMVGKRPFYQRLYRQHGVDVSRLEHYEDFLKLPVLHPDVFRGSSEETFLSAEHQEALRTNMVGREQSSLLWRRFATTGSTGAPKASLYTYEDWMVALRTASRSSHFTRVERPNVRMFCAFFAGHIAAKILEDSTALQGNFIVLRHFATPDDASLLAQFDQAFRNLGGANTIAIAPMRPMGSAGKGGTLASLLEMDSENVLGKKVRQVITGGYPLDEEDNDIMPRMWEANDLANQPRAHFAEMYGASEGLPIATSCDQHQGVHLVPGPVFAEVIDPETGRHVRDGERGLVVITTLRHGTAFIRYALGDEATWSEEPCACGKTTPRLLRVRRVADQERLRRGCAAGGLG